MARLREIRDLSRPLKNPLLGGTINRNAGRIRVDGYDGHALDWFSFAVLWYNQARPEERRKPPVNNACRWRELSRGLQRILFFACEGDLSRKSDSYDN